MKAGDLVKLVGILGHTLDYPYLTPPVGIVTSHVWAEHSNPDHEFHETARRLTKVRWLCDGMYSWEESYDLEVISESR